MQSASTLNFDFGIGWNFGVNNVFTLSFEEPSNNTPIVNNAFLLLNGSPMLLLGGGDFLLL